MHSWWCEAEDREDDVRMDADATSVDGVVDARSCSSVFASAVFVSVDENVTEGDGALSPSFTVARL